MRVKDEPSIDNASNPGEDDSSEYSDESGDSSTDGGSSNIESDANSRRRKRNKAYGFRSKRDVQMKFCLRFLIKLASNHFKRFVHPRAPKKAAESLDEFYSELSEIL